MGLKIDYKDLFLTTLNQSKFLINIDESLSEKEKYQENIQRLLILLKKKNVNLSQLQIFIDNSQNGKIFIYIPTEQFELLESLFKLYLLDSVNKNEITSQLKNFYKNIVEFNQNSALLFELISLKIFFHVFNTHKENLEKNENFFEEKLNKVREILKDLRNELYSTNIFNREFQTKIFDNLKFTKNSIIDKDLELDRELFFNEYGFSLNTFLNLLKMFNTAASLEKEIEIIDYFENRTIWSIDDILKPENIIYLPFLRDELKDIVLKSIIKKSKQTKEFLLKEKDDLEKQLEQIKSDMVDSLNNFSTNIKKETIDSIKYPVNPTVTNKINSFIIDFNRSVMANILQANKLSERWNNFQKKMTKNENLRVLTYDQYIEILKNEGSLDKNDLILSILIYFDYSKDFENFFEKFKPQILKVVKNSFEELKKEYSEKKTPIIQKEINFISELFIESKFQKKFNFELLQKKFLEIIENLIDKLIVSILFDSFTIYNIKLLDDETKKDLLNFNLFLNLLPFKKVIYISSGEKKQSKKFLNIDVEQLKNIIKKNYSKIVSVLVYDIRGSTYMSSKLNNAEKQKYIMKKFQHLINNTIKNNFGLPLKETGDGGIAIFCSNSKEIYRTLFKESVSSKNVLIRHSIATGSDLIIKESATSSIESLKCSQKLVESAEQFIKDNYINYREWFFDVQEKKLIHEGIEYALLPPEFKSLFRVGVGIASGIVNRDVNISINAFGDIDIYGITINEAKIFSGGKDPSSSIILVDHPTLFSAIINSNYIEIQNGKDLKINEDYLEKILNFEKSFIVENFKIRFYGVYYPLKKNKDQVVDTNVKIDNIFIDDNGKIFYNDEEIKFLYQVEI
uniref:Uncharacterized protein n=1 Tax=candidate division WOR-3 bacterium TaxID=2052148 RepID=A0A7C3J641_UNCW3